MKNKIMMKHHLELPLKKDSANLFLEVMSTISVFLFTITLAGFFMISSLVESWDKGIVNGFTVQVLTKNNDDTKLHINKIMSFFENKSEVQKVKLISDKQINRLMSPWLGNNVDVSLLPLPKLIDVQIKEGVKINFDELAKELSDLAPHTNINSHQIWLNKLINFASSVKLLALSVLVMVLIICAFSIFYATQTSLGIHQNIIEILHIMGATDDYIAKQYAYRSFFIGLCSGALGTILGVVALWLMSDLAIDLKSGIFDKASFDKTAIFYVASIPMFTSLISMFTAYYTVRKTLGKII